MTTFRTIEINKSFPISTSSALIEANERRQALDADIEAFLAQGGKVTVVQQPAPAPRPAAIGNVFKREAWPRRAHYQALVKTHKLDMSMLGGVIKLNRITLGHYLNGSKDPMFDTRDRIERAIDFLVSEKLKEDSPCR